MLLQFLERARARRAIPGGLSPWLARSQNITGGRARALVADARRITGEPEIARRLTAGDLSPDATGVLARWKKAVAGSGFDGPQVAGEAIACIEADGVGGPGRRDRVR